MSRSRNAGRLQQACHNCRPQPREYAVLVFLAMAVLFGCWTGLVTGQPLSPVENSGRLFKFAHGLYKQEFYEEAVDQLERLVKFYPKYEKSDAAYYLLGESYYNLKQYTDADKRYQHLLEVFPDSQLAPDAAFARSWTMFELKQYDQAAALFEQVTRQYAQRTDLLPEARFRMAQAVVRSGRSLEAIPLLKEVSGEDPPGPFTVEALYTLAELFYSLGRYEEAAGEYKLLVEKYPESPYIQHALYSLGFSRMKLGEFERALTLFKRLHEETEDLALRREALLRQGKALCNLQRYQEALAVLDNLETTGTLADEIVFVNALCQFRLKRYDVARHGFLSLVKQFSTSSYVAESRQLAAESLFRLGQFEKALDAFTEVIEQHPGSRWHESAGLHLGLSLYNLKRFEKAKTVLKSALSKFPKGNLTGQIVFALGETCYSLKSFDEANMTFLHVLELEDDTFKAPSLHRLGVLAQERGKHEDALTLFNRLAAEFPDSPLLVDTLYRKGESLLSLKRLEEAADLFEKLAAHQDSPLVSDSLFKMGETCKALGDHQRSIKAFSSLINGYKDSPLIPQAVKSRAWCYYSLDNLAEAISGFRSLAESKAPPDLVAEAQYWLGKSLEKQRDFKGARMEYLKVGILYPDNQLAAAAMFKVGECYRQEGIISKASHAFKKLISIYPDSKFSTRARQALRDLEGQGVDEEEPGQ